MTVKGALFSGTGVWLSIALARILPPWMGQPFAGWLGALFGSLQGTGSVQAVMANQWVARGGSAGFDELRKASRAVFAHSGRCQYDFYHRLGSDKDVLSLVDADASFLECVERGRGGRFGQLLAMPHYSNFDLVGRSAVLMGLHIQALSYQQPDAGYRLQNRVRLLEGAEVTPIGIGSLRAAYQRLRNGGTVLTGVDRPTGEATVRPAFFGRPASLQTGYLRLALSAGVPVVVISGFSLPDGRCRVSASRPIALVANRDRDREVLLNAGSVLEQVEQVIRQDPAQWRMFHPVWPEALREYPHS